LCHVEPAANAFPAASAGEKVPAANKTTVAAAIALADISSLLQLEVEG
jgi:hypothetical protein